MIKATAAVAVLLMATPALAMTSAGPVSPAALKGARFLNSQARLAGPVSNLQAAVVGGGLRTDGLSAFSGDGASSYGYLLSAEPAGSTQTVAERTFEDELVTYRAPGTTIYYGTARHGQAAATAQGKK